MTGYTLHLYSGDNNNPVGNSLGGEFEALTLPGLYAKVSAFLHQHYAFTKRPLYQMIERAVLIRIDITTEGLGKLEARTFYLRKIKTMTEQLDELASQLNPIVITQGFADWHLFHYGIPCDIPVGTVLQCRFDRDTWEFKTMWQDIKVVLYMEICARFNMYYGENQ